MVTVCLLISRASSPVSSPPRGKKSSGQNGRRHFNNASVDEKRQLTSLCYKLAMILLFFGRGEGEEFYFVGRLVFLLASAVH